MRAAGILHDIGKLGDLRRDPAQARARSTTDEWAEIQRHPELGSRILEHANLRDIAAWVLHHHERIDGGGYPQGLAGEAIPLEARILAVADAYEAMTADRPYRAALPLAAARDELRRGAGTQFDREVVAAFERVLDRARPAFVATLDATAPAAVAAGASLRPDPPLGSSCLAWRLATASRTAGRRASRA